MPTTEALTQYGAKKRRAFGHALNANDVASIEVPQHFAIKEGKQFLIYDSNNVRAGADRVLVFPSARALDYLRENKHWAADSTFQVTPRILASYLSSEVLTALKDKLGADHKPLSVMTDFEVGEYSSFVAVYDGITTKACVFHLAQSHMRRMKQLGLTRRYNDPAVRKVPRLCASLAFLPFELIRRGFAIIINQSPLGMKDFLFYVAKNYIGLSLWEQTEKKNAFRPNSDALRMMDGLPSRTIDSEKFIGTVKRIKWSRARDLLRSASASFWSISAIQSINEEPRNPDVNNLNQDMNFRLQNAQNIRGDSGMCVDGRRPEFAEMDRQLLNLVKNARLGTDQEIGVFLEAVSLSLQRLEPNILDFPLAEEVENDPPTEP
uniref:MULE transposase domain-containing protein n=1 Tax=Globodera rostochiensis TaxID=31243 RepID=A0A914I3W6_GLORO